MNAVLADRLGLVLLPSAVQALYDVVVLETSSRTQFWESTGVGSGVRPVRYRTETMVVRLYPKGSRDLEDRIGHVVAEAIWREEAPILPHAACLDDLRRLGGPTYAYFVVGAFLPEELRKQGIGQALYRAAADRAATHGAALAAHRCLSGTELTSSDALGVWARLGKTIRVVGQVAWAVPAPNAPPFIRRLVAEIDLEVGDQGGAVVSLREGEVILEGWGEECVADIEGEADILRAHAEGRAAELALTWRKEGMEAGWAPVLDNDRVWAITWGLRRRPT